MLSTVVDVGCLRCFRLLDQNVVTRVDHFSLSSAPHDSHYAINPLLVWPQLSLNEPPATDSLKKIHRR
ncbi:hypothetical protein BS17DRAFT_781296 [Gyrodon lividus]|nr:hypothetical protein BS17DRAFT_781296 [Gyrodon lividus]